MKKNLWYLYFLHIFNDGYMASISLLLPFIAQDLHFNLTQVGTLGTMTTATGVFLAIPAGYFAARYGGLRVIVMGMLFYSLGYIGTGLSNSFLLLFLAYSISGMGFGVFHPVAFALVARWSDKSNRGSMMGNFTAIGDVGRIVITTVLTFLVVQWGWRNTALSFAVPTILLFIYLYFSHLAKHDVAEHKTGSVNLPWKVLFRNYRYLLSVVAAALDGFASSSLFLFLPFLFLSKGISPALLGSFTAAFFVGNIGGKTMLGRFTDKLGEGWMFIIAELAMALTIVCLLFSHQLVLIIVFCLILGVLTKGTAPIIQTMVAATSEHHGNFEKSFGFSSFVNTLAITMAPIILGFSSDRLGIQAAFYISAAFAVIATIPVFISVLVKQKKL